MKIFVIVLQQFNLFGGVNNIFDILNSKEGKGIHFRRTLSPETKNEYFEYFEESINYFSKLKLSIGGKSILMTKSRTPFFGFITDMNNFQAFYITYIESGRINCVSTFRFPQDHLELLFGCIRQMFGCNDNPSAKQFESAWRRLLGQHQITASEDSNCLTNDTEYLTVLNCSSRPKCQNISSLEVSEREMQNFLDAEAEQELETIDSIILDTTFLNEMEYHIIVYIASLLQKNISEGRW